jgi:RNA polymerase sigma factor (sigma-70 family)
MSIEEIDGLLERLNRGDIEAAEQVFRIYEPSLRILVRRQLRAPLRAKFDSMDVVQSVWVDIVEGVRKTGWHFDSRAQLQAFLVRLARNRFLDRCRKHKHAVAREHTLEDSTTAGAVTSDGPRPSQVAQRNELWDRMLQLCPPAHHELLRLKREGMTLDEIAARTGLHPSSVRRILYDLAARFAAKRGPLPRPSGSAG